MVLRTSLAVIVLAIPLAASSQGNATAPTEAAASLDDPAEPAVTTGSATIQNPPPPVSSAPDRAVAPQSASSQPALARWLELQTATLNVRYRYVDNSAGLVTTNQVQHREAVRGRLKADAGGKYALNFGVFTGVRFTSGWDNTGWGINDAQKNLAFKTLYASAQAAKGLEGQIGGLYIVKGESSEVTAYDEDGYITGERVTIRRPDLLLLDEISVTSAYFVGGTGPTNIPISKRLPHFGEQNYLHFLIDKKFGRRAAASTDYTRETSRTTWRQAVNVKVRESRVVDSVVIELYQRTNVDPDEGFAVTLEKVLTRHVSLNGGYASVDPRYGPLNADRFSIGNRGFVMATVNMSPGLSASFFVTRAVGRNGALPQRTLSNTVVTYNLLPALRRAGLF
jgi:hypothetical protein